MDVQHTYCRPGVSSWRTWYIKFVWRSLWISVKNHTPFISNRLIMRFCFRDWLRNQLPQTAGTKTGSRRKTEGNFNDHLGDLNRRAFWTNPLIYVCLQRKLDMSHLSDCEVILFGANELYSNPLSLSIYPIAHTYTQVHMRAQWSVTVNYKLGLQTSDFFFFLHLLHAQHQLPQSQKTTTARTFKRICGYLKYILKYVTLGSWFIKYKRRKQTELFNCYTSPNIHAFK